MKNKINNLDIFGISLGCVIGWGAFMLPGNMFIKIGIKETVLAFTSMIALLIPIVLSYHVLARRYPNNSGGEFFYILTELGYFHGFFSGLFLSFSYITIISLNTLNLYVVLGFLFPNLAHAYKLIIFSMILLFILLGNLNNMRMTVKVSTGLSLYMFLAVIIILLLFLFKNDISKDILISQSKAHFSFGGFFRVISLAPVAFIGFDTVVQLSERIKSISKYSTIISVISGAVMYISLSLITAISYDKSTVSNATWALGSGVLNHLGVVFFHIMLFALLIAILLGINGFLMATTELLMSFSRNNIISKKFSKKNASGTYSLSLLTIFGIVILFTQFGRNNILILTDAASMGITIVYFYMSFVTIKYNKFLGALASISSLVFVFLIVFPIFYKKMPATMSSVSYYLFVIWVVVGGIIYNVFFKNKTNLKG